MKDSLVKQPKQGRKQKREWPKEVQPGRAVVRVYRRKTPEFKRRDGTTGGGNYAYMVANYVDGKRRFDCYLDPAKAFEAAETLAKRLDARDYVAANMTQDQAIEYASATQALKPYAVCVGAACAAVVEALKLLGGDLGKIHEAALFYSSRHRPTTAKLVKDVVAELLRVKESRGASGRYREDLKSRLERFAGDCQKQTCNVTTEDVQNWLDSLKLSPQSYRNFRTVLHTLFAFAVARGYAVDNCVARAEKLKVRNGDIEIFTVTEMRRLLEAASANFPAFLPCLAIGGFAGLRSAELERLTWQDIDLTAKHIVVSASNAKTASRRIVPVSDNLLEWLQPYADRQGKIWRGSSDMFYRAQEACAAATAIEKNEEKGIKAIKAVEWKGNGLRHSYASYRFALTADAGRVAGELGNSAAVVHRHYRELVKPADAERWFKIAPEQAANVIELGRAAAEVQ